MLNDRHPEEGVRAEVGNIESIEGLRGVAVILVVLFHYLVVRTPAAADPWNAFVSRHHALAVIVGNGYLGVDLFFLITGFLLILPWARHAYHGKPPPSAKDFYIRRIRRIVPAYYVQLAVLLGVVMPILHGIDYWKRDIEFIGYNAVAHLLFLHYTTPISSASMSANGPLWTLALEAQYYVLLPLFAGRFVRAPLRWGLGLVAAAIAWRWLCPARPRAAGALRDGPGGALETHRGHHPPPDPHAATGIPGPLRARHPARHRMAHDADAQPALDTGRPVVARRARGAGGPVLALRDGGRSLDGHVDMAA